jgi:Cys-tRNA(Pro)/Cys-tRNA(Cys) deacylase
MTKTNACRILDKNKISYELREYEWHEEELDAVSVARKIGLPPEHVFKTLVLVGDALKHFVAIIPANAELDLKRTARLTGNKSCAMLPVKDLLALTGYVRGGCSPIGMKKLFPTFLDSSAKVLATISISPGQRGAIFVRMEACEEHKYKKNKHTPMVNSDRFDAPCRDFALD